MNPRSEAVRLLGRLHLAATPNRDVDRSELFDSGWRAAALRLDLPFTDLGHGFGEIGDGHDSLRVKGCCVSVDDMISFQLVGDKTVTAGLLAQAGLPTAAEESYEVGDPTLVRRLRRDGDQLVLKPKSDTGAGRGITVGPTGNSVVARAILDAGTFGSSVVCQERVDGPVVRALVGGGRVLDAVVRSPAAVTGDGRRTIAALVADENRRREALGGHSTGYISTGADYRAALRRAGESARSVPRAGEAVVVSGRSNSGSEHESHRITLGDEASAMAVVAAEALGVKLGGVDLILDGDGGVHTVLEVNTCPGLHWHVLVADDPAPVFDLVLSQFVGSRRTG